MQFKYKSLAIISPLVFLLDQATKYCVVKNIPLGGGRSVISGFFDVVHYTNNGAAFGFLSGPDAGWRSLFFHVVSAVAIVAILFYIRKLAAGERLMAVILSLVMGGIFGNGLDRLRFGHVTDFLSFHVGKFAWPAFNVADSAITVAMVLLIISSFKKSQS